MTFHSLNRVLYTLFIFSLPAAAEPAKPDLSNPQIWQDAPAPLTEKEREEQCRVFQYSACPYAQDTQSDIQREAQRREQNRHTAVQEEGQWHRVKPR